MSNKLRSTWKHVLNKKKKQFLIILAHFDAGKSHCLVHIPAVGSSRKETVANDSGQEAARSSRSRGRCSDRLRGHAARQNLRNRTRHDTQHGKGCRYTLPESQEAHLALFNIYLYKEKSIAIIIIINIIIIIISYSH